MVIKGGEYSQQEKCQETEEFKSKAKKRYKTEAKNSELKNVDSYAVATDSGRDNMKTQVACTIFVVSLNRLFTLIGEKH